MITIAKLLLHFGDQILFNAITATFAINEKVGVVGRNGAGKSTFLKILAGLQKPDEGSTAIERGKILAYMPQEMVLESKKPVFDEAFTVFEKYTQLQSEAKKLEHELETGSENAEALVEHYTEILEKLAHFDEPSAREKTQEILNGLGFTQAMCTQHVNTLSVGWKMRLVLAKLLLQDADFYLFDEPTNHLDLPTKEWFFNFLKNGNFGYLLVSHDRHFLESACDTIFELERGNGTIYNGNFSKYLQQKEERQTAQQSAHDRQQREIARKKETIERFRSKASKARQAQSMIKQLEKVELIEVEPPLPKVHVTFPPIQRSGKIVLTMKNVSHTFGDKQLFDNLSCEISRGDKLALVAPNGTGKTTLFNLVTQQIPLQQGSIELGHNVNMAYFEQDQSRAMNQNNTIWDEVRDACPDTSDGTIRAFLGSFLFKNDDIYKKIKVLSGGEKNRVAMVKVLLQKANLLILDEPTNHLDLYTKDILLQALKQYQGTILLVSHDHDFIQKLATGILELTPNGLHYYPGTYEIYLAQKQNTQNAHSITKADTSSKSEQKQQEKNNKQDIAVQKELRYLEKQIAQLEKKQTSINLKFEILAYGTPEFVQASDELKEIESKLNSLQSKWESLAHKIL